jgi:diguanylate cyclase (GGDEF)-like protein/PAS domain S-box-containing protein
MKKLQSSSLVERLIVFSKFAGLLVALIGFLVLLGWIFDIQELKSFLPGFQTTKINTAIVFILSGVVLWNINSKKYRIYFYFKNLAIFFIFLIGVLTLSQYIFNSDFGIDEFLIRDVQTAPNSFPGRMSFASSVCTILIGIALIWIDHPKEKIRNLSQYPSVIVITISFLAIIGYLYDVQALYRLDTYSTMGVNAAIGFMLCALSILWVRPDEGWTKIVTAESAGGFVLRRLLLPILVVPLILGWLILLGAKAGWYESHFGLAIISVLITGFLIVTLLVNGEQLNRIDQNRKQAEESYHNVLDNMMEGAQIIGFDWRYLYVNDAAAKHGHETKENLLGRTMMEMYPNIEHTAIFATIKLCMEERTSHMLENEFTYPDGDKGWFELSVQPVEEGVFILSNDITERKKNEIALLKLNTELEQRIFERTVHLNLANETLQKELYKREQAETIISQQNKMLSELHEITLNLLKNNTLDELINMIVKHSAELLDSPYVEIIQVEGDEFVTIATTPNLTKLLGERVHISEALLSWQAYSTQKPVVIENYMNWHKKRGVYTEYSVYAIAEIPILNGERCIGVLSFGRNRLNYEFTEDQIQFGSLFANLSALVIENAQLRETLREQSIRDSLTGLFNRRYMEETLIQEISRAVRNGHSLGVIMLDIDHFKKFNDTFGHLAGDSILSQLGQFLQTNIRLEDVACRYGGEEFLLIMPDISLETALRRADLLREGVLELGWQTEKITISLGVAMYPQHGETMENLIRSADEALYQAKQNGRNRVEVANSNE